MHVFVGDFGGYFGLFLGGSIMSLLEIVDLIIYNAFVKLLSRRVKKSQATNQQRQSIAEFRNISPYSNPQRCPESPHPLTRLSTSLSATA